MYDLDWSSIPGALPILAKGMAVTLEITVAAFVIGVAWGTVLAVMRLSNNKAMSWFATSYVNLFRSVPLVMVILWFYLIVPQLLKSIFGEGLADIRFASALTAFCLFEAAYFSEIVRAGIQSVSRGQIAASYALGFTYLETMRLIILPQALRNMMPLLVTQLVILFQDTSLVYVIGLADFFGSAYKIGDRDGRLVELLLFAGVIYFIFCFALSTAAKRLQKRNVR